jgi:hypothetical protein
MKEHLGTIRDTNFPECSNCKKRHEQTALINSKESRGVGHSVMDSAENINYNITVTFNLELRSIPGCKV